MNSKVIQEYEQLEYHTAEKMLNKSFFGVWASQIFYWRFACWFDYPYYYSVMVWFLIQYQQLEPVTVSLLLVPWNCWSFISLTTSIHLSWYLNLFLVELYQAEMGRLVMYTYISGSVFTHIGLYGLELHISECKDANHFFLGATRKFMLSQAM